MTTIAKFIDESIRVAGTFRDEAGTAVDPTTVTAGVIKGDGTTAAITPTDEAGTGSYSATYNILSTDPTGKYIVWIKGVLTGFDVIERVVYDVAAIGS